MYKVCEKIKEDSAGNALDRDTGRSTDFCTDGIIVNHITNAICLDLLNLNNINDASPKSAAVKP